MLPVLEPVARLLDGRRRDLFARRDAAEVEVTRELAQEAMHETARESLRREQIMNFERDAYRQVCV